MSVQLILTTAILLYCVLPQNTEDRGWRGIIPLHSSKAEVFEKLGSPNGEPLVTYSLEDVNVIIDYSLKPCDAGWNVPVGTVLRITVNIKKNLPKFSDLNLDLSQYEKRNDRELIGITYYENEKLGIIYLVWNDKVRSIYYGPSADDNNLKCKPDK